VPLPVPGKIHALATLHCQSGYASHLIPIRDAAVILTPCTFLRVAEQIRACNVMVNADPGAAQAAEIFLNLVAECALRCDV
jgi:hypothetical protein